MTGLIDGIRGRDTTSRPKTRPKRKTSIGIAGESAPSCALEGTYSHLYKSLTEEPRLFVQGRAVEGQARPFRQSVISPQASR